MLDAIQPYEATVKPPGDVRSAFLTGDAEAARSVRDWVAGYVYGAGWRLEDPDAAVQETMLRLLAAARAGRVRGGTDFRSYVRTIARHTCVNLYRRERLRDSREHGVAWHPGADGSTPPPDEGIERRERLDLLAYIYQALPAECRRLWRWIYTDGLGAPEVAARLGITVGNARVRVHRCLERARKIRRSYPAGAAAAEARGT